MLYGQLKTDRDRYRLVDVRRERLGAPEPGLLPPPGAFRTIALLQAVSLGTLAVRRAPGMDLQHP